MEMWAGTTAGRMAEVCAQIVVLGKTTLEVGKMVVGVGKLAVEVGKLVVEVGKLAVEVGLVEAARGKPQVSPRDG